MYTVTLLFDIAPGHIWSQLLLSAASSEASNTHSHYQKQENKISVTQQSM